MKLHTEMNFAGGFIKTAYHGTLPIMEHFSKCGLPLSIIFSHSLVVCIFPCINLVDPLIQQCNISQFLFTFF